MIIKCAIVDDEPLAVELLASYVKKIPFLELCGKYNNATDALHGIGNEPVDLLFLDIQMPELNGLELSKMIPESTRIVFTTAFNQYAVDGFMSNPRRLPRRSQPASLSRASTNCCKSNLTTSNILRG